MTHEEHRQRHRELHRALDQLFADFIVHNPDLRHIEQSIGMLIEWSYMQTLDPDELPDSTDAAKGEEKT